MLQKHSKQREAILAELSARKDHPTADDIYTVLRKSHPNISLGTVYRNLSALADSGKILRLHNGKGSDRFDADISQHCHFKCTVCGCVSDFSADAGSVLPPLDRECFEGRIDGYSLMFYGVCEKCLQK